MASYFFDNPGAFTSLFISGSIDLDLLKVEAETAFLTSSANLSYLNLNDIECEFVFDSALNPTEILTLSGTVEAHGGARENPKNLTTGEMISRAGWLVNRQSELLVGRE